MDAPEREPTGSWLQRRGVDLAVWVLIILAILGIAGGTAWYLSKVRIELAEVPPPYDVRLDDEPLADEPAPARPAPPTAANTPLPDASDGPGASGPTWLVRPAPDYPEQALARQAGDGEVRLTCMAEISGRLSQCRVLRETPAGYGFGVNAVRAAEQARVTPGKIDGVAVRSEITFNVRYRLAS